MGSGGWGVGRGKGGNGDIWCRRNDWDLMVDWMLRNGEEGRGMGGGKGGGGFTYHVEMDLDGIQQY